MLILVINFVVGRSNESIREINRADDQINPSAPDVVAETPDFPIPPLIGLILFGVAIVIGMLAVQAESELNRREAKAATVAAGDAPGAERVWDDEKTRALQAAVDRALKVKQMPRGDSRQRATPDAGATPRPAPTASHPSADSRESTSPLTLAMLGVEVVGLVLSIVQLAQ